MDIPKQLLEHLSQFSFFNETSFVEAHNKVTPTSVRINTHKPTTIFEHNNIVPWCNTGFYLENRPQFIHDALWHAGAYYVQEASSMFLQEALLQHVDFSKELRVLDLCAAPGGKSTLVGNLLNAKSLLISNEVIQTRVNILAENITKWGLSNTWVSNSDPKYFSKLKNYFDVILIDAPCSGSGLFRKDEEAIKHWSPQSVEHCGLRQKRIIADALPALKNDGILIYMTCSYSSNENEEIVDFILDENNHLQTLQIKDVVQHNIVETNSTIKKGFGYRFMPNKLQGEGFFLSAFKNTNTQILSTEKAHKRNKPETNKKLSLAKTSVVENFINAPNHMYLQESDNIYAIHNAHLNDLELLKSTIKIVRKGTYVGSKMGETIIPSHDLALSVYCTYNNKHEVDNKTAIAYMQKNEITLDNCTKGWVLLCVQNLGIGWAKNLGNRINNYFPKNMRVRKELEE